MSADVDVHLLQGSKITVLEDGRLQCHMSDNTVLVLPEDAYDELIDPEYATRQHYSRATYAMGCHGPLCKLAETHRGRKRNEQRAKAQGREYKVGNRDTEDRSVELGPIIAWHLHTRGRKVRAS